MSNTGRVDLWATLADEHRATADLLAGLSEEQWAEPSLCSAWLVKDVAVHLLPTLGKGISEFLWAVVRSKGSLHRASESLVAKYAATMTTAEIVAALRDDADDRFAPPGVGAHGPYTDVLVHRLDIAVPLGIEHDRPAEPWRASLDFLVSGRGRRWVRQARAARAHAPRHRPRLVPRQRSGGHRAGRRARPGPLRPLRLAGPPERARRESLATWVG